MGGAEQTLRRYIDQPCTHSLSLFANVGYGWIFQLGAKCSPSAMSASRQSGPSFTIREPFTA